MRIWKVLLVSLALAVCGSAQTQPILNQNITATAQCVPITASGNSTVGIIVSGTWSGTLTPNLQISAATSAPTGTVSVTPTPSSTNLSPAPQATITANGSYTAAIGGFMRFNLCSTGTWTSGTAVVTLYATPAVSKNLLQNGLLPPNNTADPWLTLSSMGAAAGGQPFSGSANKASFYGIVLMFPKTTTSVTYFVGTNADNTANTYDFGLYSGTSGGTCTLVTHIGSTAGTLVAPTASTWTTRNWATPVTLQPGRYYIAVTSSATASTFNMGANGSQLTFAGSVGNVSVTAGGTLDASRTCPTDSYTTSASFPGWSVN